MIQARDLASYAPAVLVEHQLSFVSRRGRAVLFRQATAGDTSILTEFFSRLSERSLLQRYFTPVPFHLAEAAGREALRLSGADAERHIVILGCVAARVVALAELARDAAGRAAELALVVADDYQGEGIGRAICAHLLGLAARDGVTLAQAVLMAHNRAAQRLLVGLGRPYSLQTAAGVTTIQLVL